MVQFLKIGGKQAHRKDTLNPETIDTYEASLGADFTSSLSSRGTFYHRVVEDIISLASSGALSNIENLGKSRDHGFEIEAKYDFGRGTYLAGIYSYMSFNRGPTVHVGDIIANIRLSRHLNFNADCIFWDGNERAADDTRDDPSGAGIVSATMIAKKFLKGYERLELRGSVFNLLDKDWSAPTGPEIPNDLPMSGISYLLEIKYKF